MKTNLLILILSTLVVFSCKNDKVDPNCNSLAISKIEVIDENCSNSKGSILITATGGTGNYLYSINNGAEFQSDNEFFNLSEGEYDIVVKEANSCEVKQKQIISNVVSSDLEFNFSTKNAGCSSNNGEITINAVGGIGTYLYSIDGFNFLSTNIFSNLTQGIYTVITKDSNECATQKNVLVKAGDISYANDVAPIIMASCGITNCHTAANSGRMQVMNYTILAANRLSVKSKMNSNMPKAPGTISAADKEKVFCWIDD